MANYIDIYIDLPSYLIKYVVGLTGQNFLIVKQNSEIGLFILPRLTDRPGKNHRENNKPGENKLLLRVCNRYTEKKGRGKFLPQDAINEIRKRIDAMFREDLRCHIRQKHIDTGVPQRQLLRSFFASYEIEEDDFAESSMYRDFTRWKSRRSI